MHRDATPAGRGFDVSIGFHGQSIDQYSWHARRLNSQKTSKGEWIYDLFINDTRVTRGASEVGFPGTSPLRGGPENLGS